MELRQKTNNELFALYDGELAFHHRSDRGIHEAKRVLNHFHNYLGEYPLTPELAKSFLSQFKDRKPTTIARYAAIYSKRGELRMEKYMYHLVNLDLNIVKKRNRCFKKGDDIE